MRRSKLDFPDPLAPFNMRPSPLLTEKKSSVKTHELPRTQVRFSPEKQSFIALSYLQHDAKFYSPYVRALIKEITKVFKYLTQTLLNPRLLFHR